MEQEHTEKYPLHRVQALTFDDRKSARDFLKANKDRIHEFHIQSAIGQIMVLIVWKS